MREHNSEPSVTPWRVPVMVEDISETGRHFSLNADPDVRAAIARVTGLRDLPRLQADFDVTRQGPGLRVVGRVSATVGQNCVVTLEPLANEVEEDVDLLFMPQSAEAANGTEEGDENAAAEPKWNDPEPLLGGAIDLGALATEFLILGIDPYPRKPGAVFESLRDSRAGGGPFAALAGWTKERDDH